MPETFDTRETTNQNATVDSDWVSRDEAVVWHGFTQMSSYSSNNPIVAASGDGHYITDTMGRRYLDAISSVWVVTLGHALPELNAALTDQAAKISHATMLGNGCDRTIELAEALGELVPISEPRFLFASDGASAVEQALKIAFQYWHNLSVPDHKTFVALQGAYHGDTIGAMSVGDSGFHAEIFNDLRFPVDRAADLLEMADMIRDNPTNYAGAIVEPLVQAASGMRLNDSLGLMAVASACKHNGIPLIADEVATGFGRTGTLFASQQAGIRPDIMCLGKAMTGGYLPMSATAVSGEIAKSFFGPDLSDKTFYHGHTFGGNALAAAVALKHLELIERMDVLSNVKERSAQLEDSLTALSRTRPIVKEVRCKGLFAGLEINQQLCDDLLLARKVCARSMEHGVLLRSIGSTITTVPMLTSSEEEIDRIAWTISEGLDYFST